MTFREGGNEGVGEGGREGVMRRIDGEGRSMLQLVAGDLA